MRQIVLVGAVVLGCAAGVSAQWLIGRTVVARAETVTDAGGVTHRVAYIKDRNVPGTCVMMVTAENGAFALATVDARSCQ